MTLRQPLGLICSQMRVLHVALTLERLPATANVTSLCAVLIENAKQLLLPHVA